MKRFALFTWDDYYPSGGWNDFKGCFSTLQKATEASRGENWQIIDLRTGTIAAYSREGR